MNLQISDRASCSDTRLPNLKVAVPAGVTHIVAAADAEWHAAGQVAAEPATDDAGAELGAGGLQLCPTLSLFRTVWALHVHWGPLAEHPGHPLILA